MIKRIKEGQLIPRGYGIAWHDFMSGQYSCLPIGINVVAAFARNMYLWLRYGHLQTIACDSRDAAAHYERIIAKLKTSHSFEIRMAVDKASEKEFLFNIELCKKVKEAQPNEQLAQAAELCMEAIKHGQMPLTPPSKTVK